MCVHGREEEAKKKNVQNLFSDVQVQTKKKLKYKIYLCAMFNY